MPDTSVVTEEMFRSFDFEAPLATLTSIEDWSIGSAFTKAATEAQAKGSQVEERVLLLLYNICTINLRVKDRANAWGSNIVWADGRRSILPSDLRGDQNQVFLNLLESIRHPALKARLADIVWTNNRKTTKAAILAVDAYCECVEGLLLGKYKDKLDGNRRATDLGCKLLTRAFQIAWAVSKRESLPERPRTLLRLFYEAAKQDAEYFPFSHVAQLGIRHEVLDKATVASDILGEKQADVCELTNAFEAGYSPF